jgi:hypothetical protein
MFVLTSSKAYPFPIAPKLKWAFSLLAIVLSSISRIPGDFAVSENPDPEDTYYGKKRLLKFEDIELLDYKNAGKMEKVEMAV